MYNNLKILALISARGGSKRLPGKNVKMLLDKPLIAWSIEQAKESKYIDRFIVSTNDNNIAEICQKYGAQVPFMRPEELATDQTKGIDVILHAMNWVEENEEAYDLIIILQPTSPNRDTKDIDKAIELLFKKKAKAILSVCEVDSHPYHANVLPADGSMYNFQHPESLNKNYQELPVFYKLNGAIYLAHWDYLKTKKDFYGKETFAYIMPKERSVDIDNNIDFKLAEVLLTENNKKSRGYGRN